MNARPALQSMRQRQPVIALTMALWLAFMSTAGASHRVVAPQAGGGVAAAVSAICTLGGMQSAQADGNNEAAPDRAQSQCPVCSFVQTPALAATAQVGLDVAIAPARSPAADASPAPASLASRPQQARAPPLQN